MSFRPLFSRYRLWASLAALGLLLLTLLLALLLLRRPPGPATVLLGALLLLSAGATAMLLQRLWFLHRLDYAVTRDAVRIWWRGEEIIIPLPEIEEAAPAQMTLTPVWRYWPLQWLQPQAAPQLFSYATQPPERCIALHTSHGVFLISPNDPKAFLSAYAQRREFGPARQLKPAIYASGWRTHWLLHDRLAQALLGGGLALGLLLLGYVIWHYPQLPATIALHFDVTGAPDLLSPRRSIFLIPGIGLLFGFLNAAIGIAFYDYERFLSYIIWSVSVILQVAAFWVTITLISRVLAG